MALAFEHFDQETRVSSMAQEKATGLFQLLEYVPSWARAIALSFLTIPITVAITGLLLNVNLGAYLDRYLDVLMARQEQSVNQAAEKVIDSVDGRLVNIERTLSNYRQAAIAKERWYMLLSDKATQQDVRLRAVEEAVCGDSPCETSQPIPR